MDRAEALVFFLGGFSEDLVNPLTGAGGPLEFKDYDGDGDRTKLSNYQYNMSRENGSLELENGRLDVVQTSGNGFRSNDEVRYEYTGTNLSSRGGANDLLPTYLAEGGETPLVYFDSRTYGDLGGSTYNGYAITGSEYGGVRPYKTTVGLEPSDPASSYGSEAVAFAAVKFASPSSFQIIHPGSDDVFGALVQDSAGLAVHFLAETGVAVGPYSAASDLTGLRQIVSASGTETVSRFNDQAWNADVADNGQLDNITNFSNSTLEGNLP